MIVLATAGGVLYYWPHDDIAPAQNASAGAAPVAPARGIKPALPATPSVQLPVAVEAPLPEQIDRLLATHEPEKALAAYRLLADCDVFLRLQDRLVFDAAELKSPQPFSLPGYRGMTESEKRHDQLLCSGMTERMRQSRLDYLAIAAKAGVSGAAGSFAEEGPFGDLTALATRPDDPLVQEWKNTARAQLTRDADAADLIALRQVAMRYLSGDELFEKNAARAYRYLYALGKILDDVNGSNGALDGVYGVNAPMMQGIARQMSAEQRSAEIAAAMGIAEVSRQRRKR